MITEDYVSFEVAKLLKEKGFDESCYTYYDDIDDSINRFDKGLHFSNTSYPWGVPYDISKAKKYVVAPTLQMAMKWLREVYKLSIEPYSIAIEENCIGYAYAICSCKTGLEIFAERWDGKNPFVSYEESVESAIKYCLENLI